MNNQNHQGPFSRAFTLIELLVVIAVIGVLAGLLLAGFASVKNKATISKVTSEMKQVASAIETYKADYNFYPPDNPNPDPDLVAVNQLFYELVGTELQAGKLRSLDDRSTIAETDVPVAFGSKVSGFLNCTRDKGGDSPSAKNFIKTLRPDQSAEANIGRNGILARLLVCSVPWPQNRGNGPVSGAKGLNPWRYNSSNPTNNPGSFDLWVDIFVAGQTNRICNWNEGAVKVYYR